MDEGRESGTHPLRPEARVGAALRDARERRGISLRALARSIYRAHSGLVEYERGHRLAPLDMVQAYEKELGLPRGTLVVVYEKACRELNGEDLARRPRADHPSLPGGRPEASSVDRGSLELPGLPDLLPACEGTWEPLPALSVPLSDLLPRTGRVFVGREGELERLERLWKEAASGELRIVLIAGEPGVGKTRLATEVARRVHQRGATVLAGACDEDLGVPYQPFVDALRHLVDHASGRALSERLGRYPGELVRLVPELTGKTEGLPLPLRADPETERYRLFDAVASWLDATARSQPLLLVLDDLQWAAKPTLMLLRHITRSPTTPLLVLATYRDSEVDRAHPLSGLVADLRRRPGLERVSLSGLDGPSVVAFMEQAAGHDLDDDDLALARIVHQKTEGNPFFVGEVLRHLVETGALSECEGRWRAGLPVEELGIPEGVRDVIGRRLSRLSATTSEVLALVAVIGAEVELAVVVATAGLREEAVITAMEEAVAARLMTEVVHEAGRYRFVHTLVRDTLYSELSVARRVALHRRVA